MTVRALAALDRHQGTEIVYRHDLELLWQHVSQLEFNDLRVAENDIQRIAPFMTTITYRN